MESSQFILENHEGFTIVRDDLYEGGTKRRPLFLRQIIMKQKYGDM